MFGWTNEDADVLELLRALFKKHDKVEEGRLDIYEVGKMLGSLGLQLSEEQFNQEIALMDKRGIGKVQWTRLTLCVKVVFIIAFKFAS
jgi:Ca2+-binding EF-hand superfamily protein